MIAHEAGIAHISRLYFRLCSLSYELCTEQNRHLLQKQVLDHYSFVLSYEIIRTLPLLPSWT